MSMDDEHEWWRGAVVYQIYPRSFMDANGDGTGDLPGIIRRLEYVQRLGVDAIWISPFFKSPMKDAGYDVSDYRDIDPLFGRIDDFRTLLERAHQLGLKVVVDQVLSHTSDQHSWFEESRQSRTNAKADWYVWADPQPDGSPPNNWLSLFGGPAWSWDSRRQQYYLHHFLSSQPDLNFHNLEVQDAQLDNVRFWLDFGVDGFRLDVVNFYFHGQALKSNPPAPQDLERTLTTALDNPYTYQHHIYDISQPENLAFLRRLRALSDAYPERLLLGEISDDSAPRIMREYTSGQDRLHTAYTFDLLQDAHSADVVRSVIERIEKNIGTGWACWALSNHDVPRCATRWGQNEDPEAFPPVSIAALVALRGTVCLYQGEELGLPQADVPRSHLQDPYGIAFWPTYKGRDGCRTPMPWDDSPGADFSQATPWLPIDDAHRARAVSIQEGQPNSCLNLIRALLHWRRDQPALLRGDIVIEPDAGDMLLWLRVCPEQSMLVALNLTGRTLRAPCRHTVKRVHHVAGLNGQVVGQQVILEPYQALFADVDAGGAQP